jgi:hypothetical protein
LRVILDPARADAANEALLGLIKIGKPASVAAVRLLDGQDDELASYQKRQIERVTGAPLPGGSPHVATAAAIVGALGRQEGIAPLVAAIRAARTDVDRVPLLAALAMLPHTPEVKRVFAQGFQALSITADAQGQNASAALSELVTLFFDASMTDMLVRRAQKLKRDKIAMSLLAIAAIKTMDSSQTARVKALVDAIPPEVEEGPLKTYLAKVPVMFDLAANILRTCGQDTACYIAEAAKPENQGDRTQGAGLKALYMFGQLQGPEGSRQLIDVMRALEEPSLRFVASQVLDHHHPNGSRELADALQVIIEENATDKDRSAGDKPLRDAMYRLRARAEYDAPAGPAITAPVAL